LESGLIGVSVDDGVVTLRGDVWYYAQKRKARLAIERVKGVRGVVNQLSVRSPDDITDQDLAEAAVEALRWNVMVPSDRIKVRVEKGWLTLEGAVRWNFQRRAAERVVRNRRGLRGISNLIVVKPQVEPKAITERITEALEREAIGDARRVLVEVSGPEVTLRGVVRSWAERHDAEKVAWAAPGVSEVHNLLTVDSLAERAA
jgi:osmotically-inducible protein OsmY